MAGTVTKRTLAMATLAGCLAWPVCGQQSSSSSSSSGQSSSDSQSSSGNQSSGSQSSGSQSQDQKQGGSRKSSAEENPFPQEQSQKAAGQQNAPAASPGPAKSTAAENPFPEAQSEAAAKAAGSSSSASSGAANSGASSSSSSSSSSGDPWDNTSNPNPANPDGGVPPDAGRRRLGKPSEGDIESGSLTAEWKAKEDVKVGHFYLDTGDYAGAYGRFTDAARLDPTSIDAIYGLARAAEGIHKKQEALANYQLYLSIAPDGRDARAARKAVQSLSR